MNEKQYKIHIGIDVAKAKLDIAIGSTGETFILDNDVSGVKKLVKTLGKHVNCLVVVEASGGYETLVVNQLQTANIAVAVVNPRQVRDFAKAFGRLAKTDKLDAQLLAQFAQVVEPAVTPQRSEQEQLLEGLHQRRQQIVNMIVMEKNRLHASAKELRCFITKTIIFLEKQLNQLEEKLATEIKSMPDLYAKQTLLRGVK